MIVVAHVGHWLVNLIYLAPVILIVSWIGITSIRDRRHEHRDDGPRRTETHP
jgi:hypothetical protein